MWDELLLAKPAQLTTCRKQTFHSFPTYLVFLTFSLQILERNALNYYAVLTSRKLKLKKLFRHLMYFFFFFFGKKTWVLPWPRDQHLHRPHLKYHSGCCSHAWHHHAWELILLFLFFLLWCLPKYSVSSSAIVLTSRPSRWTCTV